MPDLLTVAEVAARLRCRRETVRRYIAQGQLPARSMPGGYYRVREEDLDQLLRPVGNPPAVKPSDGHSSEGPTG